MRSGPAAYKFILACIYDLAEKLAYTHFPFSCEIIVFARRSLGRRENSNTCQPPRLCYIIYIFAVYVRECVRLFTKKHLCRQRLLDFPDKKSGRGHPQVIKEIRARDSKFKLRPNRFLGGIAFKSLIEVFTKFH